MPSLLHRTVSLCPLSCSSCIDTICVCNRNCSQFEVLYWRLINWKQCLIWIRGYHVPPRCSFRFQESWRVLKMRTQQVQILYCFFSMMFWHLQTMFSRWWPRWLLQTGIGHLEPRTFGGQCVLDRRFHWWSIGLLTLSKVTHRLGYCIIVKQWQSQRKWSSGTQSGQRLTRQWGHVTILNPMQPNVGSTDGMIGHLEARTFAIVPSNAVLDVAIVLLALSR